jgi:predicted ArsR family transcriptional regulator
MSSPAGGERIPTLTLEDFDAHVVSVAALGEPTRRALYRYVVAQPEPVSRERAAAGVGVAHHIAKFHLDKLEEDGLLDVEYKRSPGRRGPGAGRPAKLYRRASRDIAVSLPERRYDLAARVMAEAISAAQHTGTPVADALNRAARAAGHALGEQARRTVGERPRPAALFGAVSEVLANNGYEPRVTSGCITLANCPFHSLAQSHTTLVCGMNLHLIDGLLDAMQPTQMHVRLDPSPDRCCVILSKASN